MTVELVEEQRTHAVLTETFQLASERLSGHWIGAGQILENLYMGHFAPRVAPKKANRKFLIRIAKPRTKNNKNEENHGTP